MKFQKLMFMLIAFFFLLCNLFAAEESAPCYKDYQPTETSRERENIEWSIIYMFGTNDASLPRVLLIGDSICNGYNGTVKGQLDGKANMTFWAGSKCVTDPQYFEELNMVLSGNHYDVITFNNGLHSLGSDRAEWEKAYRQAILFIRAKAPEAKLLLVTCTPTADKTDCAVSKELGDYAKKIADEMGLGVIDLYEITSSCGDDSPWSDGVHFKSPVIELQGQAVAEAVLNAIP